MRMKAILSVVGLALAALAFAQEGHPLTGSWRGDWTPSQGEPVHIRLFMEWEGNEVTGRINPGRNQIPLTVVDLDADDWTVHLEGDSADGEHIVIDGKLDDIGSYNRTMSGTWRQGATRGDFKLTRD